MSCCRNDNIVSICVFHITERSLCRVSQHAGLRAGRSQCHFTCDRDFRCLNIIVFQAGEGCNGTSAFKIALPCPDGTGVFQVSCCRNHNIVGVCVFNITECCFCRVGQYACFRAGWSQCHFTCDGYFRCLNIVVFQAGEGCNGTSAFEISRPCPDRCRVFFVSGLCKNRNVGCITAGTFYRLRTVLRTHCRYDCYVFFDCFVKIVSEHRNNILCCQYSITYRTVRALRQSGCRARRVDLSVDYRCMSGLFKNRYFGFVTA